VRENEYKNFPALAGIFKGKSKTGSGDAYPDFLLLEEGTNKPLLVIETKADPGKHDQAISEAQGLAAACVDAGHAVIAVAVSGQEEVGICTSAYKFLARKWQRILHNQDPITWIPRPSDVEKLIQNASLLDLSPVVPSSLVLANKADLVNRLLREADIKDEYRPAYVGAMMLALWKSKGGIRRDPKNILRDTNTACQDAFRDAKKPELAQSLHVEEANAKLANSAWHVLATLEKLNIATASFDHDYLGQLYETFFRYTGGNTIGQYFTPRHITAFMAELTGVTKRDRVIDPACGTGGFLIACFNHVQNTTRMRYEDTVTMVRDRLIGYESEPVTAALCVANMILRGDGTTGIRKADCFTAKDYPCGTCTIGLMNPPFPHKQTDEPVHRFIEQALKALEVRGDLAVIVPASLLVKDSKWRERMLKSHTVRAVCQLPDELFQPYASATTAVLWIKKGVPQDSGRKTVFARIPYDGLTLKKGTRVPRADKRNDIPAVLDAILNKKTVPGIAGVSDLPARGEWGPGAYIPSSVPTEDELKVSIDELLRRLGSFYVRYASEIARQRARVAEGSVLVKNYVDLLSGQRVRNAKELPSTKGTIGEFFWIYYGMKELHSREGYPPGDSLVISPTEAYNGCYGWLEFAPLLCPPFVTAAQTGSIGESFVQIEPCAVNDDCVMLLAKDPDLPLPPLFIAAATIRLEKWRFTYGRKLTPSRIASFQMKRMPSLEKWIGSELERWRPIWEGAVEAYKHIAENELSS
jgi:hypothetical protein